MKKKIRVRFAPSPTGALHIGSLRTALYNFLYAKQNNGDFILRIEDTDKKRYIKNSIDYILKSFKWCGINYNEGFKKKGLYKPYLQSKRTKIYKKYIKFLIKKKLAYFCFDSKKNLIKYKKKKKNFIYNSLNRNFLKNSLNKNLNKKKIKKLIKKKKYVIRIKTPKNTIISFKDIIYGKIKINTNKIDDKIIFRKNLPTYHLASVIDDHLMKISHVIRGKEWISSTPLHILIYNFFKWKIPNFAHLPLLLNYTGGKISKRFKNDKIPIHPIKYISKYIKIKNSYEEKGFLPEAFFNILALLGWSPSNKVILNKKKIIKLFSLKQINKSDIHLNFSKFCWINQQYIKKNKKIKKKLYIYLKKKIKNFKIKIKKSKIKKIINLTKNRISLINDIWDLNYYFFLNPKKFYISKEFKKKIIKNKILIINFFKKFKKQIIKNKKKIKNFLFKKIKNVFLFKILRISIVGKLIGINIIDLLYIIKKKVIIKRINFFIDFFF
ncbi:MAG: glutamate--tRNA ligase [Candidatus Shikimatogenerans sp. JK-2022]|nr:glutamate--tRNA ligase [Candidatus Shikimatogenerans bostrichidophilus]